MIKANIITSAFGLGPVCNMLVSKWFNTTLEHAGFHVLRCVKMQATDRADVIRICAIAQN